MGIRGLLSILVLFSLPGCLTMSHKEQVKNLMAPPSLEVSVNTSLNTPYFSKGNFPNDTWWEMFQIKELSSLIEKALSLNPSIQAIKERVNYAKEEVIAKRSKLYPWVYFNIDDMWSYLSKNGLLKALNPSIPLSVSHIDVTLSSPYEFDFWDKIRNTYRAAIGREKAEEAEEAEVKLVVTTSLSQTYFFLKTHLLKQALFGQLYRVRLKLYELEQLLEKNNIQSELAPLSSIERLLQAEQFLLEIEKLVLQDKHLINILAGVGPDEPIHADASFPELKKSITLPENLSIGLLSRRPDLIAQIWLVEALSHDVASAKAVFWPQIDLNSFVGIKSLHYSTLFEWISKATEIKPTLALPVFTAGEIEANLQSKRALYQQAVFEYNDMILKSVKEVADLLAFANAVYGEKDKQDGIVAAAKNRYNLTRDRECSGLDSALEKLRYREEVILTQLTNADFLFGQYAATIGLIKALGGGYSSEELPIQAKSGV